MKEPKDWFIRRLMQKMDYEDIQQIARLLIWIDDYKEKDKNNRYQTGIYSSMLADICETIFGENGTGAPSFLSYPHAGWVCGPGIDRKGKTFVRSFIKNWHKVEGYIDSKNAEDQMERVEEWDSFLETLESKKDVKKKVEKSYEASEVENLVEQALEFSEHHEWCKRSKAFDEKLSLENVPCTCGYMEYRAKLEKISGGSR